MVITLSIILRCTNDHRLEYNSFGLYLIYMNIFKNHQQINKRYKCIQLFCFYIQYICILFLTWQINDDDFLK